MAENRTYSVSETNRIIKNLLEGSGIVSNIQVRGEVSNFKRYPSGHCYFSLKDNEGVLKCVMFKFRADRLTRYPGNGETVVAIGSISVYERDGVYQLYVDMIMPEGTGALMQAYEKLKNKLAAEGLFAEEKKKALPARPGTVGIITSPAGAAVRDVITVSRRRDPGIRLLLFPVQVQGKSAAGEIARAIRFMNRHQMADVLIVGRGGGSMEDLWAFNEEMVVRAIAESDIPVVSSVGHETDVTLADFAADRRAATPSHAAELVVADAGQYRRTAEKDREKLVLCMDRILREKTQALEKLSNSRVLKEPLRILDRPEERLDRALIRLHQTLPVRIQNREMRLRQAVKMLKHPERLFMDAERRIAAVQNVLRYPEKYLEKPEHRFLLLQSALLEKKHVFDDYAKRYRKSRENLHREILGLTERENGKLTLLSARLDAVSPLKVLARGYSVTLNEKGEVLKSVADAHWGEEIHTKLNDGEIFSIIQQIERQDENGW